MPNNKRKNELTEKLYSKEDVIEFCTNLIYGYDPSDGAFGVSRRFDNWVRVFKNK